MERQKLKEKERNNLNESILIIILHSEVKSHGTEDLYYFLAGLNVLRQPHNQRQHPPHTNQHHQNIKRARQMPEVFSSPCKTDTISRCIYKQPNIGNAHQHWSKCKNLNMAPSTPDRCLSGIGQHPLQDLSSMSSLNTPPFSSYQRKMVHSEKVLHSPVIKYLIQVPDSRKLPLIPHIPKYNNQKV